MKTTGIHHVTAFASDPQRNLDFYTGVLGLRFVKRTVNFDDPGTYHFYFGDHQGSPGTILTFFPWPGATRGRQGAGAATAIAFRVPPGSLPDWTARLRGRGVRILSAPAQVEAAETRFGARIIRFEDHDGTPLELVESPGAEREPANPAADVPADIAIRGFHSVTLTVHVLAPTADLLTAVLGYRREQSAGARTRFTTDSGVLGAIIDVLEDPAAAESELGAGVVHHVALRAANDAQQRDWLARLHGARFAATDVRDRTYFRSIYFRERNGVRFEIATDGPGFTIDEPLDSLGMTLKLPPGVERHRAKLEQHLQPITVPGAPKPNPAPPDTSAYTYRFDPAPSARESPHALVLLHGTGGDENDLIPLGKRIASGAALLSPRGDVNEAGQLRFFRRLREGVFDQDDLRLRTRSLAGWLSAATRAHAIDPQRATLVGFSNGANIAAAMLLAGVSPIRQAVLIRAMVPFVPSPLPDLSEVRVLMLSGSQDPIVPAQNSAKLADLLSSAGAHVTHEVLDASHNLSARDLTLAAQWLALR